MKYLYTGFLKLKKKNPFVKNESTHVSCKSTQPALSFEWIGFILTPFLTGPKNYNPYPYFSIGFEWSKSNFTKSTFCMIEGTCTTDYSEGV